MTSFLLEHAKRWVEASWPEVGSEFGSGQVPVVQFERMDVDDLAYPCKNTVRACWLLNAGTLCEADPLSIERVPYVAFSLIQDEQKMNVQTQWAPRCGYGFQVEFDSAGRIVQQRMCWVS